MSSTPQLLQLHPELQPLGFNSYYQGDALMVRAVLWLVAPKSREPWRWSTNSARIWLSVVHKINSGARCCDCNPNTQEVEAWGFWVCGESTWPSKTLFQNWNKPSPRMWGPWLLLEHCTAEHLAKPTSHWVSHNCSPLKGKNVMLSSPLGASSLITLKSRGNSLVEAGHGTWEAEAK